MDSSICQLQADINYLEKQLVQSKIKLAQAKAELDVSYQNRKYQYGRK